MNELKLYNGITLIDDDLIEEAQDAKPKRRASAWARWGAAAACLCVIAAGALVWQHRGRTLPYTFNTTAGEIAIVPRWEEMTDAQRYQTLDFGGREYMRGRTAASDAAPGAELGTAELTGWDEYANERHTIEETVYAIDGISTDCAVLVYFDGTPCAYVNADYKPETLGEFIDDLNLTENLELGWGWYYWYGSGGGSAGERIDNFDSQLVWDDLLCYPDTANVENYDQTHFGRRQFSVSVGIPVLGYENISMWVTEDGYLCTNILETGKGFYIGEDAVNVFLTTVQERYGIDPTRLDAPALRADEPDENVSASTPAYDPSGNPVSTPQPNAATPPN